MLLELHERIIKRKGYTTKPGTVQRIFEIHKENEKDASGQIPVIINKETQSIEKNKKTLK
tara:strand:- start:235 stop:414 length:180 start_codon:yes stop_codon:yes gene_type:complete